MDRLNASTSLLITALPLDWNRQTVLHSRNRCGYTCRFSVCPPRRGEAEILCYWTQCLYLQEWFSSTEWFWRESMPREIMYFFCETSRVSYTEVPIHYFIQSTRFKHLIVCKTLCTKKSSTYGLVYKTEEISRAPGPLRYVQIASRGEKNCLLSCSIRGVLRKSWDPQEWTTGMDHVPWIHSFKGLVHLASLVFSWAEHGKVSS